MRMDSPYIAFTLWDPTSLSLCHSTAGSIQNFFEVLNTMYRSGVKIFKKKVGQNYYYKQDKIIISCCM